MSRRAESQFIVKAHRKSKPMLHGERADPLCKCDHCESIAIDRKSDPLRMLSIAVADPFQSGSIA